MLAGLKAMAAEAVQDRAAALGVVAGALLFLLTAWVLGIAAVVVFAAGYLGPVGGLASVAAGLVVLALAIVGLTRSRNRRAAEQRAMTRALWASAVVNAASLLLRREPRAPAEAAPSETAPSEAASGSPRFALLIVGGLALILLAFLFPSGADGRPDEGEADEDGRGPDSAA